MQKNTVSWKKTKDIWR